MHFVGFKVISRRKERIHTLRRSKEIRARILKSPVRHGGCPGRHGGCPGRQSPSPVRDSSPGYTNSKTTWPRPACTSPRTARTEDRTACTSPRTVIHYWLSSNQRLTSPIRHDWSPGRQRDHTGRQDLVPSGMHQRPKKKREIRSWHRPA